MFGGNTLDGHLTLENISVYNSVIFSDFILKLAVMVTESFTTHSAGAAHCVRSQ